MVRHDSSERHQRCLDAKKVRVAPEKAPLTTAVMRLTCQQNDTMLKLFRTAYCLVKQNFSLRSFQSLLSLQECNGLQLGKAYRNRTAACMFIDSIATIIKKKVINDIKAGEFFSLLIDGSTDVSVKEQEIVHVKILKDGKAVTHFLGLIMQESGNADGILAGLESFFLQLGIQNWKSKLVGLGTDGASVNLGSQAGLGAILKKDIPHLIHIHCIAHNLELAVLDACKQVGYVQKFQTTIKCVLKYYSKSGKRLHELSEVGKLLSKEVRSFGKWNPVRWIASKCRILKAINCNWLATVIHLGEKAIGNSAEASTARGILREITSVEFIYFLGFMCDLTAALGKLSEVFQSDSLSLSGAVDELDATLGIVHQLKSSPGHTLAAFVEDFDDVDQHTKFRDLNVTGGNRGIDLAKRSIEALANGTLTYLEKRFTFDSVVQDFEIFDPSNWPTTSANRDAVVSYGNEELSRILKHLDQWLRLKLFVCKRVPLHERQFHILWPKILKEDRRFSTIMRVISVIMLLPMNTAAWGASL